MKKWLKVITSFHLWKHSINQGLSAYRQGGFYRLRSLIFGNLHSSAVEAITYKKWIATQACLSEKQVIAIEKIKKFHLLPLITIVSFVRNAPEKYIREAIISVKQQIYPHWELYVVEDLATPGIAQNILKNFAFTDARIKILNSISMQVQGEFVIYLNSHDLLTKDALYWIAQELNQHPNTNLIYSDEDTIDNDGNRYNPVFKSAWNSLLALSTHYTNHLIVYRKSLLMEAINSPGEFANLQDYDLLLRAIEKTTPERIRHIPRILYHKRAQMSSVDDQKWEFAATAIAAYLQRQRIQATVEDNDHIPSGWRVRFQCPAVLPKVAIIIPTRDKVELLKVAVSSLLDHSRTAYSEFELFIVDNASQEQATFDYFKEINDPRVKIIAFNEPFNWSRINNFAVTQTDAPILLFLNNDVEPINADWLHEMVSYLVNFPQIAVVGAKLYYPDDTIQHAGITLGIGGVANHLHARAPKDFPGYQNCLFLARNVSAVTGACMLVRRPAFDEHHGFDENLSVAYNDVEFCVRLVKAGHQIVWTPYAELYHKESATRGTDQNPRNRARFKAETDYIKKRHGDFLLKDPFYNPNLSLDAVDCRLAFPPRLERSVYE